jgi:hypothetical protein
MSTFTPVVPTSPPQSNSAPAPGSLPLEARFRASQYNRAESLYDLASRLNVSDTSKLNIDAIPSQFDVSSKFHPTVDINLSKLDRNEFSGTKPAIYAGTAGPNRSFARAQSPVISKLDIDSIPAKFNVNSRLSGLPSQSSKLNIDSIPAKFNVTSRLSGLPSQSSKLNIDSIPSRYSP